MFIEAKILENAVVAKITKKQWGNSRKGNVDKIQTDAKKDRLKLHKVLVVSPEYVKLTKRLGGIDTWAKSRAMPTGILRGTHLFKIEAIKEVKAGIKEQLDEVKAKELPAFLEAYPAQKEQARADLNGQYKESDYPTVDQLRDAFDITIDFFELGVPDNLSEEERAEAAARLREKWEKATEDIIETLWSGFSEYVDHAVEKLTVKPGQKVPDFKENMFMEKWLEFFETFNFRNVPNDGKLAELVDKAKEVISLVDDAKQLKDNMILRQNVAQRFTELKTVLDEQLTQRPSRKFDLDEGE